MNFRDIPIPEVYKASADFRFFLEWIETALAKTQYDTDNLVDLLDPERCPEHLLWMLSDTMGYRYDSRLPVAYNRLVLLYFMAMIYNRGSKNGMTLAAEVNLAQFNIIKYGEENEALQNRLEDTTIPVNSVYVTAHTAEGYIDTVYFSENIPTDVCTEYVRPLGMYSFTHAGVRVDSRTKISVDARLTDANNVNLPTGPTRIAHYRRSDYASLQKMLQREHGFVPEPRNKTYYRNSKSEGEPTSMINPGYRALYSLQLCNNEHTVKALIPSAVDPDKKVEPDATFSLGYGPQDVTVTYPDNYLKNSDNPMFNLRYDRAQEESFGSDVYTLDADRTTDILNPRPAVNPKMATIGDAISLNTHNTKYIETDESGKPHVVDK